MNRLEKANSAHQKERPSRISDALALYQSHLLREKERFIMEHTSPDQEIIVQDRVFGDPSLRKSPTAAPSKKSLQVWMQTWTFGICPHVF